MPIETTVIEFDDTTIRNAIQREFNRGGQVFFLHNRVTTIETMAERMFHSVRTAQGVYAKGTMVPPKRVATQQGSGGKRQRVTVQNMHI